MLNRKVSNIIFYGILVLVTAVILGIRWLLLSNIDGRIADLDRSNIQLQNQIEQLEITVEEYQDVSRGHIYDLYLQVPNYYMPTILEDYTKSQLDTIGIDESEEFNRSIELDESVSFEAESAYGDLQNDFKIVQVSVGFTTNDTAIIDQFINQLNDSQQIFVIKSISYAVPSDRTDDNLLSITLEFLAFYVQDELEEAG